MYELKVDGMTCGGCAASVKRVTDAGCKCECGCRLGSQDRKDRDYCAPGCREISDRRCRLRCHWSLIARLLIARLPSLQ